MPNDPQPNKPAISQPKRSCYNCRFSYRYFHKGLNDYVYECRMNPPIPSEQTRILKGLPSYFPVCDPAWQCSKFEERTFQNRLWISEGMEKEFSETGQPQQVYASVSGVPLDQLDEKIKNDSNLFDAKPRGRGRPPKNIA